MEQRDSQHQRGHRRTGSSSSSSRRSSGLLVCCFNWGSSMKISSESMGRKLRRSNNGGSSSIKGSSMFKKRGNSGGEIDEPSSPKVTCIGLVRVKTKRNQVMKKMRTKSKRRGGEASFRRIDHHLHQMNQEGQQERVVLHHQESLPHRDHRWIHLPFAICEALKGLRNELMNCVVPNCSGRSSACTNWGKSRKSSSSCGAVFMRWLFALQESDGENIKRRVEIVVEEKVFHQIKRDQVMVRETEIESPSFSSSSSSLDVPFHRRRSLDESKETIMVGNEDEDDEEVVEEARLSMCSVPPRNALSLMRCRSEPSRRSTLATRFLDDSSLKSDHENGNAEREIKDNQHNKSDIEAQSEDQKVKAELLLVEENRGKAETEQSVEEALTEEIKIKLNGSSPEPVLDDNNDDDDDDNNNTAITIMEEEHSSKLQEEDDTERFENREQKRRFSFNGEDPLMEDEQAVATLEEEKVDHETSMEDKSETQEEQEQSEIDQEAEQELHRQDVTVNENQSTVNEEEEDGQDQDEGESRRTSNEIDRTTEMLSDCLMMMMREPKVSMELSKETWVCSTDFIRHHQQHHQHKEINPINGGDESTALIKTKPFNIRKPKPIAQPPPHPPPQPKPTVREEKQVNANGGSVKKSEPLELTRCKSEPLRSSAKLAPEACFWKDMKLIVEPHRRSTIGAAGVGF